MMNELTEVEEKVTSRSEREGSRKKAAPRVTASTATQELDMLMADLSDFKMPPTAQTHQQKQVLNICTTTAAIGSLCNCNY